MIGLETLATSVDTWECDENEHMNVQFYWAKFHEAERRLRFLAGWGREGWRTRHVRHHRELHAGGGVVVRSAIVADGPHPVTVAHEMYDAGHGFLAATAFDGWSATPEAAEAMIATARARLGTEGFGAMPEAARARGIAAGPPDPVEPVPSPPRGVPTVTAEITPALLDGSGRLAAARVMGWASNAAPHVWARIGLAQPRLDAEGLGRVAMEAKLTWTATPPGAGDLVHVVSSPRGAARTTFALRHDVVATETGRRLATLDVVALTMDLATRRAIPLPADVLERMREISATVSPH